MDKLAPKGSKAYDVVICARNNAGILGATLDHVRRQTLAPASCTVVDGRSTDGTPDLVRNSYPWAEVVIKDADDGPASSRNIGAHRGDSEFILFLDSDVLLDANWAEEQMKFLERNQDCAVCCGELVFAAEPERIYATYGALNRYGVGWEVGRNSRAGTLTQEHRCLWCATACMLMRRAVFYEVGEFDAVMFAYHEDSDLGWRTNIFGYSVCYNPKASAQHKVHGTMNPKSLGWARIAALSYRNRFRSAIINYEWPHILRYVFGHLVLFLGQTIYRGPRWARLGALKWNIVNLRDTLKRRRFVQAGRRRADRDLWPLFERGLSGPGYYYD
jgi:GT2 family glycosyltransferase